MSDLRETAEFVDGQRFIDWLHDRYGEQQVLDRISLQNEAVARRWYRWRHETSTGLICVYKLDEFLRDVFDGTVMLHDVPDECFTAAKRTWHRAAADLKRDAMKRLRKGEGPTEVAMTLGVSPSTVHKWRKTAAA